MGFSISPVRKNDRAPYWIRKASESLLTDLAGGKSGGGERIWIRAFEKTKPGSLCW